MRIAAITWPRSMISNPKKWIVAGVAALVLITCTVILYVRRGKTVVPVETVERRLVPIIADLPAQTEAAVTVEVRANVEGRLTEMSFQEGNLVKKGQVLFRIDPRRCAAALQLAQAAVEKAQGDLEMAKDQQHLVNAVEPGARLLVLAEDVRSGEFPRRRLLVHGGRP